MAFIRLRGLWLELRSVLPSAALLPERPIWVDVLDLRDATFRLHRQVIEIRDASCAMASQTEPRVRLFTSDAPDVFHPNQEKGPALGEGASVRAASGGQEPGTSQRDEQAATPKGGRPRSDARQCMDGIFYVNRTGCQ